MGNVALEQGPDPGDQIEVARLAVTLGKAREDAHDLGVPLGSQAGIVSLEHFCMSGPGIDLRRPLADAEPTVVEVAAWACGEHEVVHQKSSSCSVMGAPDTREGRFELYSLHVILLLDRLKGEGAKAITVSLTNDGTAVLATPGSRVKLGFDPDRAVVLPHGPLADE